MAASGVGALPVAVFHFRVAHIAPSAASCAEPRLQCRYRGGLAALPGLSGLYGVITGELGSTGGGGAGLAEGWVIVGDTEEWPPCSGCRGWVLLGYSGVGARLYWARRGQGLVRLG